MFLLVSGYILCQNAHGQVTNAANDVPQIDLGKGWKIAWVNLSFGAMVQASKDENAQLEAKPFVGGGPSFVLSRQKYGISVSALFYMNDQKTLYPLLASGIVLFNNRVALSMGWDFGKISGAFEKSWQERVKALANFNFDLFGQ